MKICATCSLEYADDKRFCERCGAALRSPSTDIVGRIIADRYHISGKIGEGGMGAVYLGEHVKMGRKSAIKVISRSMAQDPEAIARFNREAANAARINHPNVCGIYDFGETDDGLVYLAMELVEGGALTDLINREGALAPDRAARILKQTADALQAAHDLGIVHRDLKPDNIMIAQDRDGSDLVKVVDFGIAKAMGANTDQKVTKTGLVVGTPEYMSPEQLSGDQLDGRSDTYSLGLVLFRMLTGKLPFQAESAQEIMILRLTDEPMRLEEAVPGASFPPRLQHALDRALARMPADRYQQASSFGRDVMAAVSTMPDADAAPMVAPVVEHQRAGPAATDAETIDLPSTQASERPTPTAPPPTVATPETPIPSSPIPTGRTKFTSWAATLGVLAVGTWAGINIIDGRSENGANGGSGIDSTRDTTGLLAGGGGVDTSGQRPPDGGTDGTNRDSTIRDDPPDGGDPDSTITRPPVVDGLTIVPAAYDIPVDRTDAQGRLAELMFIFDDTNPGRTEFAAIRDTAMAYYVADVSTEAKSDAAYVVALALQGLGGYDTALRWAQQAADLNPGADFIQQLITRLHLENPR